MGENAAPVIWLTKKDSPAENAIKGQATLTPEQARDFAAGKWYVNLHTQAHPGGEIRGQGSTAQGLTVPAIAGLPLALLLCES
jgi:hypothetical protein